MRHPTATLPVITALLDEATRKRYAGGVLGVRAKPEWEGPDEFDHRGVPVRVVGCPSALAVREALLGRAADRWLVLLTDRDESELGLGITSRLAWQRLRRPDPWGAVQDQFGASRVEHGLVSAQSSHAIAAGLLAATPADGWPPARVGLLTTDHAFGAVAALRLGLGTPGDPVDLPAVLRWGVGVDAAGRLADLRAIAGDALVDTLLDWVAGRCGSCAPALLPLLRDGRAADAVPLGLVARVVLAAPAGSGPRALLGREVDGQLPESVLGAWAEQAELVTQTVISADPDAAARVLARAEALLDRVEAGTHADESVLLRRGLTARLADLGEALRRCATRAGTRSAATGFDGPLADPALLAAVEQTRVRVQEHALARHPDEARVPRALAAVRLVRWLARAVPPVPDQAGSDRGGLGVGGPGLGGSGLGGLMARQRDEDAWVDRAVAQAWTGVDDEALAQGLRAVLAATQLRRDAHDSAFGQALAAYVGQDTVSQGTVGQGAVGRGAVGRGALATGGLIHLEDLLPEVVLPLARHRPVLLVVADGMSQANATEIIDDVIRRYDSWLECLPGERDRRIAALTPLPSLTTVCRTSLFSGTLATGEQQAERAGLAALAKGHHVDARLFHKVSLDSSLGGYALAHEVADAIDDTTQIALVACVLNTIDDALDRSDPGGTRWSADTVRHLRPLLDRARAAGRIVVLTSDHGHVVERRQGQTRPVGATSSNRSRPFDPARPAGEDEIRVRGQRVLLHGGDAVLAVSERLRYGPLKAGYHGGGAPAEVVVPVSVLASGEAPPGWRLAPPQSPPWWRGPLAGPKQPPEQGKHRPESPMRFHTPARLPAQGEPPSQAPTLFDAPELFDLPAQPDLATVVLGSPAYREQRQRAARAAITDKQVRDLLSALLDASAHRLDAESAAAALGVATVQLTGALSQAQRLLNVEQYPVLRRDADGSTVILDATLLCEQFGVTP